MTGVIQRPVSSHRYSYMKAMTPDAMVMTLPMVFLASMAFGSTALPTMQKLPSPERPFVYIHVVGFAHLAM